MGRWAQRRIRGGGPITSTSLLQITDATTPDLHTINVTWSGTIDAGDFAGVDFTTLPSAFNPVTINQAAADQLDLDFADDISTENEIDYTGNVTGLLTPDSHEL